MPFETKAFDRAPAEEQDDACPVCEERMGTRKVTWISVEQDDTAHGYFVHTKGCLDRELAALRETEEARRQAERERERQERLAANEARAAARGGWDAFVKAASRLQYEADAPEARLAVLCYAIRDVPDEMEEVKAKFTGYLETDPGYAVESWSGPFTSAVAKVEVFERVRRYVEAGVSQEDILAELKKSAARYSSGNFPFSRSTSVMHNLMEDCRRHWFQRAVNLLDGTELFGGF